MLELVSVLWCLDEILKWQELKEKRTKGQPPLSLKEKLSWNCMQNALSPQGKCSMLVGSIYGRQITFCITFLEFTNLVALYSANKTKVPKLLKIWDKTYLIIELLFFKHCQVKNRATCLAGWAQITVISHPSQLFSFSQSETFAFPEYHSVQSCISQNTFKIFSCRSFFDLGTFKTNYRKVLT